MKRYRLAVLKGILVLSGFLLCISNAIAQRYVFRATWGDLGSANTSIARAGGLYAYSDGSYIVTETQTNRLHRFSQAGVLIDSFGGTGTGDGQFWGPSSPVALSDGTLYIGDYLNERVQVFSPTGTYLWQFDGSTSTGGKFGKPHSLAVDSDDNVYILAQGASYDVSVYTKEGVFIRRWTPASNSAVAQGIAIGKNGLVYVGWSQGGRISVHQKDGTLVRYIFGNENGDTQLSGVLGLKTDANGNLYVADTYNHQVRVFNAAGTQIAKLGTKGTGPGKLERPIDVQPCSDGKILVTDEQNACIQVFDYDLPDYKKVATFSGNGTGDIAYSLPATIDISPSKDIYLIDYNNLRVARYGASFDFKSQWLMQQPGASFLNLACAPDGTIYTSVVTPNGTDRINHYSADGVLLGSFGSTGSGNGQFYVPRGLAITQTGIIYVVDCHNHRIEAFDLAGNYLFEWGGYGSGNSQFVFPTQVATDANGLVYIMDRDNSRVQVFSPDGVFLRKWGSAGSGPGQFSSAEGIRIDKFGNVLVADHRNGRVQKFNSMGLYLGQFGLDGTSGGLLNFPIGMAEDDKGFIYVSEHHANRIHKYKPVYESVPPVSSIAISGSSIIKNWYNTAISVTVTADDGLSGTGVAKIHTSINNATELITYGDSVTLTLTDAGNYVVTYFAIDNEDNQESPKSTSVGIDTVKPQTVYNRVNGTLELSATDSDSGVSRVMYRTNAGSWLEYSSPISDAVHTIEFYAVDLAGNVETAQKVTVNPGITAITTSNTRFVGGSGLIGTVTLEGPAPLGGSIVTLTSSRSDILSVPDSVLVPEGSTSTEFDIEALPVSADSSVLISGELYETTGSILVTVMTPTPVVVTFSQNPVIAGNQVTGTVNISGPAPLGGSIVRLASSSLSALVPTSVTIPAGQMTATFAVATNLVSNDTSAVLSATVYGVRVKSTLSILGPKVTSVTVASTNVASAATTTGTVTLSTNAPVGGKVVTLSSSNAGVASVPVSVTVPAGSNTATFTITAGTVAANTAVTITATTNSSSGTATVTITPPAAALSGITTNVAAATGGVAVTGTVTLTRAAPTGGAVIVLASSPTTVGTVPASVTVPAGATSVTFTITTRTVTAASTLTVTGTYLGVAKTASITVNPVRLVSILTLNPTSVRGGTNSTGTVTLTGPATEAVVVTLTSGTTTVARVPASVTVPAGATTVTFTITTLTQTATRTSVITARTGTTSRTATLTVTR